MRKPAFAICEQDSITNTSSFYIQNFKLLASFCSWADWFESYLVENPEDRFSRDGAQLSQDYKSVVLLYSKYRQNDK